MNHRVNERRAVSRTNPLRLIRLDEVLAMCGLSRTTIYEAIREKRFPAPVAVGERARAWISHEVEEWVAHRIRSSRRSTTSNDEPKS